MLSALMITSVYAYPTDGGPGPNITIGSPPAAAIALNQTLLAGGITFTYPNGQAVVLSPGTSIQLQVCGTNGGCQTVTATLDNTAPGHYTYNMNFPTGVYGAVTVTILANSVQDSYGQYLPAVNTVIGSMVLAAPSSSSAQFQAQINQPSPNTEAPPQSSGTLVQMVAQQLPSQDAISTVGYATASTVLAVISALAIAGLGLVFIPKRGKPTQ